MKKVTLSHVLLEHNDHSRSYPALYCRTYKPIHFDEDLEAAVLYPFEMFDFTTFFNACSNIKWRTYTAVEKVLLHLEIRGTVDITFTRHDATLSAPLRKTLDTIRVEDDQTFQVVEYEFAEPDADFFSFEIFTHEKSFLKNAYYYTEIDESHLRPVELAVVTTTFKQEAFVTTNIKLFENEILGSSDPISKHFHLHVIDNGKTLDIDKLTRDKVTVYTNKNVGGSGGFTRGIIESLHQMPKATHILLMDDDIEISPESLKRTYTLLSLVKDEYAKAFVSGAMLSYEKQDEFYQDIGCVLPNGEYGSVKPQMNFSELPDIIVNDTVEIRKPHLYAGWWYCCIPVTAIEEHGLPLPLFIRSDDAEYGERAADGFITMNGICVWHLTLQSKFRAALECYQIPRNSLIAQATTDTFQGVDFISNFKKCVTNDLRAFNYDAAELALDGLEDFLEGPEFIMQEQGEAILQRNLKKNELMVPIEEFDLDSLNHDVIDPHTLCEELEPCTPFQQALHRLTYNGHRLPEALLKKTTGVVPCGNWAYPMKKMHLRSSLLAVSLDGKHVSLRTIDKQRFNELNRRFKKLIDRFEHEKIALYKRYNDARPYLTSEEFWKEYLEM